LVRHTHAPLWGRCHLLTAFAVTAAVVVLVLRVFADADRPRPVARTAVLLAVLVGVQLFLGVEAWMIQFGSGELPEMVQGTWPPARSSPRAVPWTWFCSGTRSWAPPWSPPVPAP